MTVYLDIIFLENICMNYIILLATGIILKIKISYIRIFLSSTLGSVYAIFSYAMPGSSIIQLVAKIVLSIIMVFIAFNPNNIKKQIKELLIFYLTSFAFGGTAFALIYFLKPQNIFMKNGIYVGTYPLKMAILGGIVGFILITLTFKIVKSRISKKDMICNIEIEFKGKNKKIKAIIDTGNMLKDPISKMPVAIVQKDALEEIISSKIIENTEKIIGGEYEEIIEIEEENYFIANLKIIPFSSIGKEHGLLLGFKADRVIINYNENEIELENIIIGIYDKKLFKSNEYKALIGLEMIEGGEKKNEYFRHIKI